MLSPKRHVLIAFMLILFLNVLQNLPFFAKEGGKNIKISSRDSKPAEILLTLLKPQLYKWP